MCALIRKNSIKESPVRKTHPNLPTLQNISHTAKIENFTPMMIHVVFLTVMTPLRINGVVTLRP